MTISSTRLRHKALLAVFLMSALSACAPVVVGGAVMTGLVAADRRTSGAQLEDEGIELRANARVSDTFGTRVRVSVTSYNRQVLLTGEAPNENDRQRVEQVVAGVENVRRVVNEIVVLNTPTLTQRSGDALVTGRVKAAFVDAKDLSANAFKVVTERGTTYLMGLVTKREADRATEIARDINGVKRVVRIFEIISDEELKRLQLQSSSSQSAPAKAP